jgi:hypothetical protein
MLTWAFEHRYVGTEFGWISTDEAGHMAYLSVNGLGPIPELIVAQQDEYADVFECLLALRKIGSATVIKEEACNRTDWIEVAERGVYAFDWNSECRRYELIASPEHPLKVGSIEDQKLRDLAVRVLIPARFSEVLQVGL